MDDYYQCERNNGTYCLVKLDLVAEPNNQLMDMIQGYSDYTQKHFNYSYINRGICVTGICRALMESEAVRGTVGEASSAALQQCVNEHALGTRGLGTRLTHVQSCYSSADPVTRTLSSADRLIAALALFILALNLVATAYDYILHKNKQTDLNGNQYLLSFSISQNWKCLMAPKAKDDTAYETLRGFDGIKATCSFLVVWQHISVLFVQYVDNTRHLEMTYLQTPYYMLYNGLTIVQVFFVISGFLLVYNLDKKLHDTDIQWTLLPKLISFRWWRLTPAYALVIAFQATWLRHTGSGPMWQTEVEDMPVADCRKYWWKHLLYIHNYEPNAKFCMLPAWHIATDAQLFVLGVIVYIATKSRGRTSVLTVLLVLGTIIPAFEVWRMNINPIVMIEPETFRQYRNDIFYYFHNRGHNNIPCFVIGMFCASLVRSRKINNSYFVKNKFAMLCSWLIIPVMLLLFMTGRVFYESVELLPIWFRMAYAAGLRLILGVLTGFGIVAMTMRMETGQGRFWKWRGWHVPSRLSYGVYLVHMSLVHYALGTKTSLMHISPLNVFIYQMVVFLVSLLLALPLHLLVEAPVNQLIRILSSGPNIQHQKSH